jgi:hypothetical protein
MSQAATTDPPSPDNLDKVVHRTIRRLRWGAALVGFAIALSLPAARLYFGSEAKLRGLDVEVEQLVDELSPSQFQA